MSTAATIRGRLAGARPKLARDAWPLVALAAVFTLAATVIWRKSRDWIFNQDEWAFLMDRRENDVDAFLAPHNDHLSLVPIVIYKTLLELVGMTHYGVFMAMIIAINLACGALVFALVRTRIGDAPAVAIAGVIVILGRAWEDILWPFQIGFLGAVAAGLGMLLALERNSRRGDVVAAVLLAVALASSGVGAAMVPAAAVYIAVAGRDRLKRALRVLAIPVGLYLIWYLAYKGHIDSYHEAINTEVLSMSNVERAPRFAFQLAGAALAALTGFGFEFGPALLAVLLVALGYRLVGGEPLSARFWAVLALAAAFFGLTALARVGTAGPEASRYLYPGAVVLALVGAELAAGRRLRGPALAGFLVIAALAVLGSLGDLRAADRFQTDTDLIAPKLTMLELARGQVDPGFQPEVTRAPDIRAGPYFAAIDEYGSPADSPAEVEGRTDLARQEADLVSVAILGLEVNPAPPEAPRAPAPPVERTEGGTATARDACHAFAPERREGGDLELALPAEGLLVEPSGAQVEVRTRRFAGGYHSMVAATLEPRTPVTLVMGRDRAERPWHVRLSSRRPFVVCGRAP